MGARQGFGGGALQKRAGLFVNRAADEVVRSGVANVEFDRRVEFDNLDQVGFEEIAPLFRHFLRGGDGIFSMQYAIWHMKYGAPIRKPTQAEEQDREARRLRQTL